MCFCGIIHTTKAKKTKPKTEYQKAGWRHDPFPEELEEEDEEEKEDWHYHSMEERLNEVGMSMRDFF